MHIHFVNSNTFRNVVSANLINLCIATHRSFQQFYKESRANRRSPLTYDILLCSVYLSTLCRGRQQKHYILLLFI